MPTPENVKLPAVLLDTENQMLASGTVEFLFCENRGQFWPKDSTTLDKILKCAATVQMSDMQTLKIQNRRRCAGLPPHFHFDVEPV
jgi:hypothetical protein